VSTSKRYVPTAQIRDAVKGRETDVLKELGVQWNSRSSHIACPYPDHPDHEPSWRWDHKCIEKKGHSIFDVIAAKEGLSFEAAKMRVAEIIGRLERRLPRRSLSRTR
jgi:hypothetical protein